MAASARQTITVSLHARVAVRVLKHIIIMTGQHSNARSVDTMVASDRERGRTEAAAMARSAEDR